MKNLDDPRPWEMKCNTNAREAAEKIVRHVDGGSLEADIVGAERIINEMCGECKDEVRLPRHLAQVIRVAGEALARNVELSGQLAAMTKERDEALAVIKQMREYGAMQQKNTDEMADSLSGAVEERDAAQQRIKELESGLAGARWIWQRIKELESGLAGARWICGCGWANGANLAVCAACGRTPTEGKAKQHE